LNSPREISFPGKLFSDSRAEGRTDSQSWNLPKEKSGTYFPVMRYEMIRGGTTRRVGPKPGGCFGKRALRSATRWPQFVRNRAFWGAVGAAFSRCGSRRQGLEGNGSLSWTSPYAVGPAERWRGSERTREEAPSDRAQCWRLEDSTPVPFFPADQEGRDAFIRSVAALPARCVTRKRGALPPGDADEAQRRGSSGPLREECLAVLRWDVRRRDAVEGQRVAVRSLRCVAASRSNSSEGP